MRHALLLVSFLVPGVAAVAQDIRITGASWVQSIDLRPLRRDSVLRSATVADGSARRAADGQYVSCLDGGVYCTFLRSGERETTRPLMHDLSVAAWGIGEGISFHAHGRLRESLGGKSEVSWPRLNDRFDLIDAYLEVDRNAGRLRLGRQWSLGALGAYNYDGGSLALKRGWLDAEVVGGRALVQGLNEPYTSDEIGPVDDLPPESAAWMFGGQLRARPGMRTALSATYLRVIQDDRSGLYAERAALDASTRALGVRVTVNSAFDLASGILNEARVRGTRSVGHGVDVTLDVRRHRPFFELWTVWGAFAPIGFDELRGTTAWSSPDGAVLLSASGARRQYDETGTGLQSIPLRNNGWRVAADASWTPGEHWLANASYGADIGFGTSQSDGNAGLTWRMTERAEFGVSGSAVQTIYEFRVGTGRVLGLAMQGNWRVTDEIRLRADAGAYRHRLTNDALGQDWSQRRASVRVEWALGADPGAVR